MGANSSSLERANKRIDKYQKKFRDMRESEISSPPTRPAPTPPPRRQAPKPPPTRPAPKPPQRTRKRRPHSVEQNYDLEIEEESRTQQPPQQPQAHPNDYGGYTVQSAEGYNPNDYVYDYNSGYSNDVYRSNNNGYQNASNNDDPYGGYMPAGGYNPNDYGYDYNSWYSNNNGGYSNDVYRSNNNGYQNASNNDDPEDYMVQPAGGYNPNDYGYDYNSGYSNNNGGQSNDVYSSYNNGYQNASNNNNPEGCSIM